MRGGRNTVLFSVFISVYLNFAAKNSHKFRKINCIDKNQHVSSWNYGDQG